MNKLTPTQIIARHADFVANGERTCSCGWFDSDGDENADGVLFSRITFTHHLLNELAKHGYVIGQVTPA